MTAEDFNTYLDEMYGRSKRTLTKKAKEYASNTNRLANFYQAAGAQDIPPTQACVGMMTKHFVSVSDMAKNPEQYSKAQWQEKLGDLRNYTFLLEAILIDMEA